MNSFTYLLIGYFTGVACFSAILVWHMSTRFTDCEWTLFKSDGWKVAVISIFTWPIMFLNPMRWLNPTKTLQESDFENYIVLKTKYDEIQNLKRWNNMPRCSAYLQSRTKDVDGMKVYGEFLFHINDLKKVLKKGLLRNYRLKANGERVYFDPSLNEVEPLPANLKPLELYLNWLENADETINTPTKVPNEWVYFNSCGYGLIKKNIGKIKCLVCNSYVEEPDCTDESFNVIDIHIYESIRCKVGHRLYMRFSAHYQMPNPNSAQYKNMIENAKLKQISKLMT